MLARPAGALRSDLLPTHACSPRRYEITRPMSSARSFTSLCCGIRPSSGCERCVWVGGCGWDRERLARRLA